MQGRIQPRGMGKRQFPGGGALKIMPEDRPRCLPAETPLVQLLRLHIGEVQARSNGIFRKAGIMFQPADALLRHCKQKFAVPHDARRGIMHLRVVNPQCDHALLCSLLRTNTSESTSSKVSQGDEWLFLKSRSTKRTGPYSGEVHPPGKTHASWKAIIPFAET